METTDGVVSLDWNRACERCSFGWLYVYELEKRRGGEKGEEREREERRERERREW